MVELRRCAASTGLDTALADARGQRTRLRQKIRRGWASASCAECRRRTSTLMNESWNRWRQFGLSCISVSGVNEIVVVGSVTMTSVLCLFSSALGAR